MFLRYMLILLISLLFFSGCSSQLINSNSANPCLVVLGGFDIGSGTTKYKVAKVDVCSHKVVTILYEDSVPVGYKSDLGRSLDKSISAKVLSRGAKAINILKEKGMRYSPVSIVGVATAAFREAVNGSKAAMKLSVDTGVFVEVISQKREGELGFWAAMTQVDGDYQKYIVWDIGGASMQISTLNDSGDLVVYRGHLASVEMRDWLISSVQEHSLQNTKSPNPIGESGVILLDLRVQSEVQNVPRMIRDKISSLKNKVVGVGGVHHYSISGQIGKLGELYLQEEVMLEAKKRALWSDDKIGGDYASTDVVNLLLVSAFMKELKVKSVRPLRVNNTDGLFLHPEYFREVSNIEK